MPLDFDIDLDVADLWLASLSAAGRSPATLTGYRYAVDQLRAWRVGGPDEPAHSTHALPRLAVPGPALPHRATPSPAPGRGDYRADLTTLTRLEAMQFVKWLTDSYQPGGVESRVKRLRALWSWLVDEELAPVNVFARIQVSVPHKEQPAVSDEVLEEMLASAKRRRRDLAIITCFSDTGARKNELARVEWNDIDLRSGVLHIRVSKTRARSVPLSDRAVVALGRWHMAWFKAPGLGTGRGAWKSDDPYSLMVAVTKRHSNGVVTPHQLRRRFAIEWLRKGGSESGLMRIAGWNSTAMVRLYVAAQADTLAHVEMRRLLS